MFRDIEGMESKHINDPPNLRNMLVRVHPPHHRHPSPSHFFSNVPSGSYPCGDCQQCHFPHKTNCFSTRRKKVKFKAIVTSSTNTIWCCRKCNIRDSFASRRPAAQYFHSHIRWYQSSGTTTQSWGYQFHLTSDHFCDLSSSRASIKFQQQELYLCIYEFERWCVVSLKNCLLLNKRRLSPLMLRSFVK